MEVALEKFLNDLNFSTSTCKESTLDKRLELCCSYISG